MDFIIDHIGIFIGFFIVAFLAIIGYFADKKDNEKKDNKNNVIVSEVDDNVNDSDDNYATPIMFDELPIIEKQTNNNVLNSFEQSDNSNLNQENNNFSNNVQVESFNLSQDVNNHNNDLQSQKFNLDENVNVSTNTDSNLNSVDNVAPISSGTDSNLNPVDDVAPISEQSFGFSNFENLDMSLEDLEKKNYENIISESGKNANDDNFYYSDISDDFSDYDPMQENLVSENINISTQDINQNKQENSPLDESTDLPLNNDAISDSNFNHEFDNEVVLDSNSFDGGSSVDDLGTDVAVKVQDDNAAIPEIVDSIDSNAEIPEIVDSTDDSMTNSDNSKASFDLNSDTDDDIWKF